jgi:PTH2 family peptidyl-tRNA hydrolase
MTHVLDADIQAMLDERARTMAEFTPDHRPLLLYAIYRADLEMPPGKLSAQCGHAFQDARDAAILERPDVAAQYKGTGHGTKVCMYAKNQHQLLRAYRDAKALGLPCALVIDRGHKLPPHFDGNPIITAVGIGPVYQDEVKDITKRYTLAPMKVETTETKSRAVEEELSGEQHAELEALRRGRPAECRFFAAGDEYLTADRGWADIPEELFGKPIPQGYTLRRVMRF